jgi:hypothetical protein
VAFENGHAAAAHARGKVRFDSPENRAESDTANLSFGASGEIASLELSGQPSRTSRAKGAPRESRQGRSRFSGRGLWHLTRRTRRLGHGRRARGRGSRRDASSMGNRNRRNSRTPPANARSRLRAGQDEGQGYRRSSETRPSPRFGKAAGRMVFDDAAKNRDALGEAGRSGQGASRSSSGDDITLKRRGGGCLVAVGPNNPGPLVSPRAGRKAQKRGRSAGLQVVTARRVILPRRPKGCASTRTACRVTRGAWHATAQKARGPRSPSGRPRGKIEGSMMTGGRHAHRSDSSDGPEREKRSRALDLPDEDKTTFLRGAPGLGPRRPRGNRVSGRGPDASPNGGKKVAGHGPRGRQKRKRFNKDEGRDGNGFEC